MQLDTIARELADRYNPASSDEHIQLDKNTYMSESIIPTDIFVYSGQGSTLETNIGELIDLSSMTVNCILGQNDPWVNANMIAYLTSGRPSFLTTRLGHEFYYRVAKRILNSMPIKNAVINHRQCNGSDVTELAVLASYRHRVHDGQKLASFSDSYHGQNLTAYMMSGLQKKHRFLVDEQPVMFFPAPSNSTNVKTDALTSHDKTILQALDQNGDDIFALIIEPIQVNNNVNTPSMAFFEQISEIARRKKFALILDEVQTGFGWLGAMSGAEKFGIDADHIALSKAITAGNGPLSALVSKSKYQDVQDGSGAKTNGADIRSLVASNAVMDRLLGIDKNTIPSCVDSKLGDELSKGLLTSHADKSELLTKHLDSLIHRCGGRLGRLSGYGLIRGVEVLDKKGAPSAEVTKNIQSKLLQHGVLVRHSKHTLIFKPPLTITELELAKGFETCYKLIHNYHD